MTTANPDDWFPAQVTAVDTSHDLFAATVYSAKEIAVQGDGTVSEKIGGREITAENPAIAVSGGPFAVGDIILVRTARNAGGLLWEAIPLSGGLPFQSYAGWMPGGVAISSDDTWTSLGVPIDLPGAGTYLVKWTAQAEMNLSAIGIAGMVLGRLYDYTASAYVPGSIGVIGNVQVTGRTVFGGGSDSVLYTVTGETRLFLYALRTGSGCTWTTCNAGGVAGGYTNINGYWLLLGP